MNGLQNHPLIFFINGRRIEHEGPLNPTTTLAAYIRDHRIYSQYSFYHFITCIYAINLLYFNFIYASVFSLPERN